MVSHTFNPTEAGISLELNASLIYTANARTTNTILRS